MLLYKTSYQDNIDEICEEIYSKMVGVRIDKRIALKFKLYIETIFMDLLRAQITDFGVEIYKKYSSFKVSIIYSGEKFNPLQIEDNEDEDEFSRLFYSANKIDSKYLYQREDRINRIVLCQRIVNASSEKPIIAAFGLSILVCILIRRFFGGIVGEVSENFLQPIITTYIQLLMLVVCPMIFFSIATSIAEFESLLAVGAFVKKFLKRMGVISVLVLIIGFSVGISLFSGISNGVDVAAIDVSFSMLPDIFPSDLFRPFINANLLQIIMLGVLTGIGILSLGGKKLKIIEFFLLVTEMFMYLLKLISKGIPLLIFASALNMFLKLDLSSIWNLMFVVLVIHIVILAVMGIYTVYVAKSTNEKPTFLVKALLPSFLTAFMSASSYSARASMYDCASKTLKADERESKLLIDIGSLIFWVGSILYRTITIAYVCDKFNIATLLITGLAILVITIATPSLPCGGITTAAVLLTICNVNLAVGLPVFIIVDMITDNITTGANVYCVLLEVQKSNGRKNVLM